MIYECEANNSTENKVNSLTNGSGDTRVIKTARRRSLSGNDVPIVKPTKCRNPIDNQKQKSNKIGRFSVKSSSNPVESKKPPPLLIEKEEISLDSNSSSSGQHSISANSSTIPRSCGFKKLSATSRMKHYLSEHLVKYQSNCTHPEFHSSAPKRNCDSPNMFDDSKPSSSLVNCVSPNQQHPLTHHTISSTSSSHHNHGMASSLLHKLRSIQLQQHHPSNNHSANHSSSSTVPEPSKMPRVDLESSISFSPTSLLKQQHQQFGSSISSHFRNKTLKLNKRQRLTHSASYDPEFRFSDIAKFSAVLNLGLKRVTENDRFVVISNSPVEGSLEFLEKTANQIECATALYNMYLDHTKCYDLMPESGKVVIIDSRIAIGRAVDALEDNVVRGAPIWSNDEQEFRYFLSVYDIPPLLYHLLRLQLEQDPGKIEEEQIRHVTNHVGELIQLNPDTRLSTALRLADSAQARAHSQNTGLLIIDHQGAPLCILRQLEILQYLHTRLSQQKMRHSDHDDQNWRSMIPEQRMLKHPELFALDAVTRTQMTVTKEVCLMDIVKAMADSYASVVLVNDLKSSLDGNNSTQLVDVITIADLLHLIRLNQHRNPSLTYTEFIHLTRSFPNCNGRTFKDPVLILTDYNFIVPSLRSVCNVSRSPSSLHELVQLIVSNRASYVVLLSDSGNAEAIFTPLDVLVMIMKCKKGVDVCSKKSSTSKESCGPTISSQLPE